MTTLRQYRADVQIRRAPLPRDVRAILLDMGCRTYRDVLEAPEAPPEALRWAREVAWRERVRQAAHAVQQATAG